ncbi:MAG: adenylate/guanylate cyclase domain-containing protein [Candidatus Kapaibacterium sp.]
MNNEQLQSLLTQADAELNRCNYDKAKQLANEVLAHLDSFPASAAKEDSGEGGDVGDAEQQLTQSTLRAISNRLLGVLSWRRGDYPKALEHYNSALILSEEIADKANIAATLGNIGNVYGRLSDYSKALEYCSKALTIDEELGNKHGIARHLGNIGIMHSNLSDYPKALEYYGKALTIDEVLGNKAGVAIRLGNIGLVYWNLSDYTKALEYYGKALTIYEELGNKEGEAMLFGNIGLVYLNLSDYPKALEYLGKALTIAEELGNKAGVAMHLGCIGNVHLNLFDYPKALEYFGNALTIDEELGNKSGVASLLGNIGATYSQVKFEGFDAVKAEEFLLKALAIFTEIGEKSNLVTFHKILSELYEHEKRWEDFAVHFKKHIAFKDEVNVEEVKKQDAIREQRKVIELAKAKADAKHQATEQLLHNVLPPSIANKMLDGATLIAEKIPSVSVLFADIVNFTKLSQRITPEELVEGLDRIFSTFDALAEKHGLEKIKTIGDAYMVVSGAPIQRENHAEAMAHFALEMIEAMKEFRSISTGEEIQLRIGIHSGEVVAGVIGKNKFAYDLWGDAVNTASRMESHGEAGKIHVSEEFMQALKTAIADGTGHDLSLQPESSLSSLQSLLSFSFQKRGELDIKGKGKMRTYFMEAARNSHGQHPQRN